MARYLRTDEFLLRLLESRSVTVPLNVALRVKLIEAGIPAARHKPCRCWTRGQRGGYGRLWNGLRIEGTHNISQRINNGPIPDGHDVLHHCDVPACWEPTHLWTGTQGDNNRDRDAKGRNGGHKNRGRVRGPSLNRGDRHPRAKLDLEKAQRIIELSRMEFSVVPTEYRRKGGLNVSTIARDMGVSESLVRGVIAGRNWAWL